MEQKRRLRARQMMRPKKNMSSCGGDAALARRSAARRMFNMVTGRGVGSLLHAQQHGRGQPSRQRSKNMVFGLRKLPHG
tara:strand:+ start:107 stop:343 length:237 start_codon:yes stop_codon:yes gene_type:complete